MSSEAGMVPRDQLCSPYRTKWIWLREKVSSSTDIRVASGAAGEAVTAVQVNSDTVSYAEALATGTLFYILQGRLAIPGRVG